VFEVGRSGETPEFSIYRLNSAYTKESGYLVEFGGERLALADSVEKAHTIIKEHCREQHIKGAGVTELFGRNRQFITTNRYGFKKYKGED
jgi:hypothetical protein